MTKTPSLQFTTLTLTEREYKNTVIHGSDGKILYWIKPSSPSTSPSVHFSPSSSSASSSSSSHSHSAPPPPKFKKPRTVVYRANATGQKEEIAAFEFRSFEDSMIYFGSGAEGRAERVKDLFPRKNKWVSRYVLPSFLSSFSCFSLSKL